MTRTQTKVLVIGLVVMVVFGAALFGGLIPGLKPNYAGTDVTELNGVQYYFTVVYLLTPFYPANQTAPQPFVFHNVTFLLWVTNWFGFTGGLVRGNGTESNGTAYSFVLGESYNPRVNASLFISPDREFAVYWPTGVLGGPGVRLMVRVPASSS